MNGRVYNTGETEADLKKKYNYEGSTLRKTQLRMLEMLAFLDKLCKQNNITYFIAFGTLLGAVRHGGFIPWDDDLDVYINPKDLKRLRSIINRERYPYVVQCHKIDRGFVRYYSVLRDLRSEYIRDQYQHKQRKYRGVQIDLFPYQFGVLKFGQKLIGKTYGLNEKFFLGRSVFFTEVVFHFAEKCLIPLLKLISFSQGKDTIGLGYETGDSGFIYKTEDVFPLSTIQFEGITVPCPRHPDQVLQADYGLDYMNLPEEKDRDHHKIVDIIFYD